MLLREANPLHQNLRTQLAASGLHQGEHIFIWMQAAFPLYISKSESLNLLRLHGEAENK